MFSVIEPYQTIDCVSLSPSDKLPVCCLNNAKNLEQFKKNYNKIRNRNQLEIKKNYLHFFNRFHS